MLLHNFNINAAITIIFWVGNVVYTPPEAEIEL